MPTWRCPHCGVPQPEAARCWVCHRTTAGCGTCRNFRQSVSPGLGYCGIDRTRQPLHGDEIRACWEPRSNSAAGAGLPVVPFEGGRPDPATPPAGSFWGDTDR